MQKGNKQSLSYRTNKNVLEFKSRFVFALLVSVVSLNSWAKEETKIELESYIVGDKEQPAVSYFVPWQGTSAPDKLHWNIEDKNDKTLDLVDRDVMLRSIEIYNEMELEKPIAD